MTKHKTHSNHAAARKLMLALAAGSSAFFGAANLEAQTIPAPQPGGICTRSCWGARSPNCSTGTMSSLNRAIIHHTAGSEFNTTGLSTSKTYMRNIQNFDMDVNGWCDFSYHFTVDKFGNIFEGRLGSMSSLPVAYHDACNDKSFAFTLLGYFHPPNNNVAPQVMLDSLYNTIAWRMPSGWSPYGTASYCYGTIGKLDSHQNVRNATACPGNNIIPLIGSNRNGGTMRNAVASRRYGAQPPPPPTPPASQGSRVKGDFNNDGKEDIAVVYDYGNATTTYWIYLSTGTAFAAPASWWASGPLNWDSTDSQVVTGDFNGDGKADIASIYNYGDGTSKLWTWLSTGTGFQAPVIWWASAAGAFDEDKTKLIVGDFNNDGKSDVGAIYNYGSATTSFWVFLSTGSAFTVSGEWWQSAAGAWDTTKVKYFTGDFNADGKTDVGGAYNYGGTTTKFWTWLSTGTSFGSGAIWFSSTSWDWTKSEFYSGDFNGDGKRDVGAAYDYGSATTKLWVFNSTGSAFSAGVIWWTGAAGNWDAKKTKWVAGDFTGGGKTDVTGLYDLGGNTSQLWTWSSSGTAFSSNSRWWLSTTGGWLWSKSTPF